MKTTGTIHTGTRKVQDGFIGYIRHYKNGKYFGYQSCSEVRPSTELAMQDAAELKKTLERMEHGFTPDEKSPAGLLVLHENEKEEKEPITKKEFLQPATTCKFCGKPLTRQSSIVQGMGDVCDAHHQELRGKTLTEHYSDKTFSEAPDLSVWMRLDAAIKIAAEHGISGHRFMQVCGGDRAIRKPLLPVFEIRFYKHVRYIRKECLKHLDEARLK